MTNVIEDEWRKFVAGMGIDRLDSEKQALMRLGYYNAFHACISRIVKLDPDRAVEFVDSVQSGMVDELLRMSVVEGLPS